MTFKKKKSKPVIRQMQITKSNVSITFKKDEKPRYINKPRSDLRQLLGLCGIVT